ncbi:MAG TPA: ABC transporter permease [Thermomicrobiales bacterium]|nr:ABC transporter permease [Thermomicrobiales bacterium]
MSQAGAIPSNAAAASAQALARETKTRTYRGMAWRRFRSNLPAMAGLVIVIVMITLALAAGLLSKHVTGFTTYEQHLTARFMGIGQGGYLLGSDAVGRDVATRLLYGARVSLGVAGLSIVCALLIGITYGLVAGYYGGWIDNILMRFVDIMLAIPTLFLLLLIASMWKVGPVTLAFVIAAVAWVTLSRLVRGEVLSVKERDYVEAARASGASNARVMFRHILPNITPIVIIWAGLRIPSLILWEATLSYLGLGIQQPTPSWGNMLSDAQRVWGHSISLVLLPGLAIFITVFAINLAGNGLRDALDPRLVD